MLEVTLQAVRVGGLREQSAQFGLEAALLALQAAHPGREVLVLPDQMQEAGLQANGGSGLVGGFRFGGAGLEGGDFPRVQTLRGLEVEKGERLAQDRHGVVGEHDDLGRALTDALDDHAEIHLGHHEEELHGGLDLAQARGERRARAVAVDQGEVEPLGPRALKDGVGRDKGADVETRRGKKHHQAAAHAGVVMGDQDLLGGFHGRGREAGTGGLNRGFHGFPG